MSEIEPNWAAGYELDYDNFCAGQELYFSMKSMMEELQAGKHVSVLFTVRNRDSEAFVVNLDYEASLLGLEDTEDPHLIVGEADYFLIVYPEDPAEEPRQVILGSHDIMRIPLSEFTSMHYSVYKPKSNR